MKNTVHLTID